MEQKVGRNDPCPCGSGKKFKSCCINKPVHKPLPFKAKLLSQPKQGEPIDLMDRTFGHMIKEAEKLAHHCDGSCGHSEGDLDHPDKSS